MRGSPNENMSQMLWLNEQVIVLLLAGHGLNGIILLLLDVIELYPDCMIL